MNRFFPPRVGDPLFTKKQLRALLIPLIVEQILSAAVGVVDTMMVAQVGESAMSGVSLVDSINMLLINIFAALSTGGTIVTSQYLGRKDRDNACLSARQALLSTFVLAAGIAVIAVTLRSQILHLLYGKVSADVMESALAYFLLTALAYPFMAVFGTCAALFRAMGNARLPMIVSIIMNILNFCGNALFIFVFHMGAAGAALATLISRIFASAVLYHKLRNPHLQVHIRGMFPLKADFSMIRKILAIGIPTGIENGMFQIGKVSVQSIVSSLGTSSIAAVAVANSLVSITVMPGMAIGLGLVTVAGQSVGAGRYDQTRRYTTGFTLLSMGTITALNICIFLMMDFVLLLYGIEAETEVIAREIIYITLLGTSLLWPFGFTIPNALRSANDAKFTMTVAIVTMWLFRVGLGYVLAIPLKLGAPGIWYGMMVDWIFRAVFYISRFYGRKWEQHRILGDVK